MEGEVVGSEISTVAVKNSEILVGALMASDNSLYCNSVLILCASSYVCQIVVLFGLFLHFLASLAQFHSLVLLQHYQVAECFPLLQQNLVAIVGLPGRDCM